MYRCDRDLNATGKFDGGGVCVIINDNWCTNVSIISKNCTKNLEHISLKCRPYYLPREFSSVTITGVYIHPHADTKDALSDLSNIVSKYENKDPNTASILLGDFNQANLRSVLPNFYQVVTCPTRKSNTLDHCYTNVKSSYKSYERSGLGNSDHSVISIIPKYLQKVKQSKPVTSQIHRWTDQAVTKLKNCIDTTDWNVFRNPLTTIDEYTDTVIDYIRFCVDICIPVKTTTRYPNSNRWYDKHIRDKIVQKDKAYKHRHENPNIYKCAKHELRVAIKNNKRKYKNKLENIFESGDSKTLWSHMREITKYKGTNQVINNSDPEFPNQLNQFYSRFDRDNNTVPVYQPIEESTPPPLTVSEHEVRRCFYRVNVNKAAGPDAIKPKLLKLCSSELSPIFTFIFN